MLPTFGDNNAEKKHQTPNKDQKPPSSFLPPFALVPFFSRLFPFTVFLSASSFLALHLVPFSILFPTKPFRGRRHFHRCQQVRKHNREVSLFLFGVFFFLYVALTRRYKPPHSRCSVNFFFPCSIFSQLMLLSILSVSCFRMYVGLND